MNKIFCLETEWDQTLHDLKKKSPVLPLLDFLENAIKVDYTFRQVATESDFKYYIEHLHREMADYWCPRLILAQLKFFFLHCRRFR